MQLRGILFYPFRLFLFITLLGSAVLFLKGCSAGKQGLLSITPQQYFYSAKERLETIDERNYEIRDLDEIIRVLENAEKDAKKGEIIDKSRLYLTLVLTLKARKQYQSNILKGQYRANRAQPFMALDVKAVQETLRDAKKWLRQCRADFKTAILQPDLNLVEAQYYTQKMLTQAGAERRESFWHAVQNYRLCLARAPDFKSDFRLFGKHLTPREVRLKLVECLALGGEVADAYAILADYSFSPVPATSAEADRADFPWYHMKGFVLAMMGQYEDAAKTLAIFKVISPQDYPLVEEALWALEGVYDRLREITDIDRYAMEARIVASLLKKWKGPFSKESYTTAAHLFPRWLPADLALFKASIAFYAGDFDTAGQFLASFRHRALMSSVNRKFSKILRLENELYSGRKISDEILEEVLELALDRTLTPLQRDRIGFLLARYVAEQKETFGKGLRLGEGQNFMKSLLGKPWALSLNFRRGQFIKSTDKKSPKNIPGEDAEPKREPSSLLADMYAQRSDDWIVSVNLHVLSLPGMSLIGEGRIVGREEEGKGWLFKGEGLDELRRRGTYLAFFEYDNSDSEKSIQGFLLDL